MKVSSTIYDCCRLREPKLYEITALYKKLIYTVLIYLFICLVISL